MVIVAAVDAAAQFPRVDIKVVVDPALPPDTVYLISPPKREAPRQVPATPLWFALRPECVVKITNCI